MEVVALRRAAAQWRAVGAIRMETPASQPRPDSTHPAMPLCRKKRPTLLETHRLTSRVPKTLHRTSQAPTFVRSHRRTATTLSPTSTRQTNFLQVDRAEPRRRSWCSQKTQV